MTDELTEGLWELAGVVDENALAQQKANEDLELKLFDSIQKRTESNDQVIAELFMGFAEISNVLEVLLHKLWGEDIKQAEDFKERLSKERKKTLGWLSASAKSMSTSEQDLADTMASLLADKPSTDKEE